MPVLYGAFQSVLKDKNGNQLFYPRALHTGNVSTEQISREIAAYSSLTKGDVKNTLDNMVTVVSQHLQSSESVTIDGFGTFRLLMKSGGKGVKTLKEVSASQSSLTVRFLPCSTRNLDGTLATRALVAGARCVRFDRADTPLPDEGEEGKPDGGDGEGGGETPDPAA